MAAIPGQNQGSPVPVAIGVLVDRKGESPRVLLSKRHDSAVLGGFWELPGGKIEPDETPAAALEREFLEELGVTVGIDRPIAVLEHDYDHATVRLHAFYCSLIAGEPTNKEVVAHRWVDVADLRAVDFPPANAPLIEMVVRELTASD